MHTHFASQNAFVLVSNGEAEQKIFFGVTRSLVFRWTELEPSTG